MNPLMVFFLGAAGYSLWVHAWWPIVTWIVVAVVCVLIVLLDVLSEK